MVAEGEECPDAREPTAEEIKEQGNQCVRAGNYKEAILHYSQAIKMSQNPDATLFSNRSLAFLKMKLFYYANEDADRAIQLRPDWAKGYFRRGEVQTAAGHYETALLSYGRALHLQPNDITIINAAQKVASLSSKEAKMTKRLPWIFVTAGAFLGVIISLADSFLAETSSLNTFLAFLLTLIFSLMGYGIYRMYRYMVNLQRKGNLEPPVDLLEDFQKQEETEEAPETGSATTTRNRYTKAQARQRFRKGKP